jgi:hypothetical protein
MPENINERRKMKLNELLKRITPLPWRKVPVLAEVLVSRETLANQDYALHAANVLPELVAAAKNLQENWERNLTEPMARLNEALARAEEVNHADGTHHP